MRVAIGRPDGTILRSEKFDTPETGEMGAERLIEAMRQLRGEEEVSAVVVGIAGVLHKDRKSLRWSPHLEGWVGYDLHGALSQALSLPVTLENDAALGALGEAVAGAGAGSAIVAYVAVGTGIGGARIVDGKIDRSAFGFEIGHQYVSGDVELEEMVSGTAVERSHGVPAKDIMDMDIWREYAKRFAYGLYNTLLHWSPDTVVLSGSLMRESGMHVEDIRAELERINRAIPSLPDIRHGKLEYPGLVGALILTDS